MEPWSEPSTSLCLSRETELKADVAVTLNDPESDMSDGRPADLHEAVIL